ncbi:phosphopantetheine-binding protein [Pleionea litopenaei]|uniref:Phosphopantetheine-binding protein n=1 Tax=Pleionea litopenaei TaxID=3070815 RepID=A0AA51X6X6_9GAMM|nr:phosphopantetheine-binding protein [Pleionea sp. HL-JVS1]WMS87324.1 phosphopantetheine-binding protein [Pleionea sp. HL-JVS1]
MARWIKAALPAVDGQTTGVEYVAPRNAAEEMLCEIWGEVLRRESVGIHDNFFSIGGDSILSIRIVSELKKLGWFLAVQDIFVHQTISKLSLLIKKIESEEELNIKKKETHIDKLTGEGKEVDEGVF